MALSDQDKNDIKIHVKNVLSGIVQTWGIIIGVTNLLVILSALIYVFFILPGSAAQEAKSQINTEIAGLKESIIEQSSEALISLGKVKGNIDQVNEDIEPLNKKYSDASKELDMIRKDIKTLLTPEQKNSAAILRELENSPKADSILGMLSELKLKFGKIDNIGCKNPKSGTSDVCQCPKDSILIGISHADIRGDDKDTERITGIWCQEISITKNIK